ncbi:hypothetical protein ACLOJK_005794 [Asimina triloba]
MWECDSSLHPKSKEIAKKKEIMLQHFSNAFELVADNNKSRVLFGGVSDVMKDWRFILLTEFVRTHAMTDMTMEPNRKLELEMELDKSQTIELMIIYNVVMKMAGHEVFQTLSAKSALEDTKKEMGGSPKLVSEAYQEKEESASYQGELYFALLYIICAEKGTTDFTGQSTSHQFRPEPQLQQQLVPGPTQADRPTPSHTVNPWEKLPRNSHTTCRQSITRRSDLTTSSPLTTCSAQNPSSITRQMSHAPMATFLICMRTCKNNDLVYFMSPFSTPANVNPFSSLSCQSNTINSGTSTEGYRQSNSSGSSVQHICDKVMEIESVKCECCGLKEDCTQDYIQEVTAKFGGKWLCGLCAEAVRDELSRGTGKKASGVEEAMKNHMSFCRKFKSNPAVRVADGMRQMLRRRSGDLSGSSSHSSSKKFTRSASKSQVGDDSSVSYF